jgi:hypothetical protein
MAAESCSGSLKPAAKLNEAHITMAAIVVVNTITVLFIRVPPVRFVCGAENEVIIETRCSEVKMERKIKTLDLII